MDPVAGQGKAPAAARDDVTHVIYVCAFAVPVGASLVAAATGVPTDWWIFAEDGESIMSGADAASERR